MPRRLGGKDVTSRPPISTRPSSAVSSPAMTRSSVVFPHPDGPRSTTHSPSLTSSDTPSRARTRPNVFPTFSTRMAAMVLTSRPPAGLARRDAPHAEQVPSNQEQENECRHHQEKSTGEAERQRRLA